jgi:hypothetical protein
MFRASSCPSSGATIIAVAAFGLPSELNLSQVASVGLLIEIFLFYSLLGNRAVERESFISAQNKTKIYILCCYVTSRGLDNAMENVGFGSSCLC